MTAQLSDDVQCSTWPKPGPSPVGTEGPCFNPPSLMGAALSIAVSQLSLSQQTGCRSRLEAGQLLLGLLARIRLQLRHPRPTAGSGFICSTSRLRSTGALPLRDDLVQRRVRRLDHDVPFTGRLELGRDYIRSLNVDSGFAPSWKLEHVVSLDLQRGHVTRIEDVSAEMAARLLSTSLSSARHPIGLVLWLEALSRKAPAGGRASRR
jgi:hypothetical protein